MISTRLLTVVLLIPLFVLATPALAGGKATGPIKAQKYDNAGRAMTMPAAAVPSNRNDVIHRYRGGPKYPH
jgi:uncharacterized membrane protein AbrB (regulator of aidB expression)